MFFISFYYKSISSTKNGYIVIRKAQEYERLLQLKTAASGFHIQGTTQMVVCLDLAASAENQIVDKVVLSSLFCKILYNNLLELSIGNVFKIDRLEELYLQSYKTDNKTGFRFE